ncbi:hypothetical protein SAMN05216223_10222 [Actinacidiphila yanglinensis]|uniref:Uncharacterized protein n=1 Tax=Actinacidiphila yanglinensis TaxID=310779 RepID=A0A1H5UUX8_9ACTN|nr:DUF6461 domain-containing protein [Actinacidiphila yanglinensis]SEF78875.1 hypothetical protein SAMN05216223_10222 [Actinacidiphila yanglinensis]
MTATAEDYLWFPTQFPELAEAYCLTLVRGVPPGTLLTRLAAEPAEPATGAADLVERSYDAWDTYDSDRLLVGATALGDWTLVAEANGYVGITEALIRPLSAGTTVVSHFRNINAVDHFTWWEDGDLRLDFEPLFAHQRSGSTPDALVDAMRAVGFDLDDGPDRDFAHHTEAAFALAEHLTATPLTPAHLAAAPFTCGLVSPR